MPQQAWGRRTPPSAARSPAAPLRLRIPIVLDGGTITNGTSGNNDYLVNFAGGPEGAIPTPVESIQEFRVSTCNHSAGFSGSSGSETVLVTKRGSNDFHGSAYWYHQNDNLNSNTWDRNRLGQARPESKDNRFGAVSAASFRNFRNPRRPTSTRIMKAAASWPPSSISRLVPTDTFKAGHPPFPRRRRQHELV